MTKIKSAIIAASVFGLVAGTGAMLQTSLVFAGGAQKTADELRQKASENVPKNIQRSTPSAQEFEGSGSGPGSRGDQLTEMDEVEAIKNPTDPKKLMKKKGIASESATDKHSDGTMKDKK